jgi:serine/threonine-protein kinase HipA
MKPVASGDGLSLNVSETDNSQDLGLASDVAKHFRVKPSKAKEIIAQVRLAVGDWRVEAKKAGIARSEQDRMALAFRANDAAL